MSLIRFCAAALGLALASFAAPAAADDLRYGGKLLLTGGVSDLEGAGGGGLATWATITGYGAADGIGANLHATVATSQAYTLKSAGLAVGLFDRLELSYARQAFDTRDAGVALGLGRGFTFDQDVVGAKLRLSGDAVYGGSWAPQIAVGAQFKRNDQGAVVRSIGAKGDEGLDLYVAATKVLLAQSLVVDATVRLTKANQTGLLGFGGDRSDAYAPQFEGSVGYLLSKRLVVGAEYRTKPNNLGFSREDDWFDLFAAYALDKHLSATLAYADLGEVATVEGQHALYLSLQAGF